MKSKAQLKCWALPRPSLTPTKDLMTLIEALSQLYKRIYLAMFTIYFKTQQQKLLDYQKPATQLNL